jgi:hypothetical protein
MVLRIKCQVTDGMSIAALARKFATSRQTIMRVRNEGSHRLRQPLDDFVDSDGKSFIKISQQVCPIGIAIKVHCAIRNATQSNQMYAERLARSQDGIVSISTISASTTS